MGVIGVLLCVHSTAHAWDAPMCVLRIDDESRVWGHGAARICEAGAEHALACWATRDSVSPPQELAHMSEAARNAFDALERYRRAGRIQEALVSLASLRVLVPVLADRWDSVEGQLFTSERRGCDAWNRAISSPNSAIAARARVGFVRCLLSTNDRRAAQELRTLLTRYPELPDTLALRMLDARMREGRGDVRGAIAIYRDVDLSRPEEALAADARDALERLAALGHRIPPSSSSQLLERATRIVRLAAPELAHREVDRLLGMRLPPREHAEVMLLAARVARTEGRFGDAEALTLQAAQHRAAGMERAEAVQTDAQASAHAELVRLLGSWRTPERLPTARLFAYLRVAARASLQGELHRALDAITSRSLPCGLRLEAGVVASGSADDERVARVLETCIRAPGAIGVAARYHRARALERLGRNEEARRELALVIDQDRTETRWYALWSRQRLGLDTSIAMPDAIAGLVADDDRSKTGEHDASARTMPIALQATGASVPPVLPSESEEPTADTELDEPDDDTSLGSARRRVTMTREQIERSLEDLATRYADAFPWFARGLAHLRLGDDFAATEELHEAALAWHEARGLSPVRAGVEAVYRGASPPRRTVSRDLWRARRALDNADRLALADIAASLGDHGLAVRFGGRDHAATRPRAYEEIVTEVAEARGLDPNLLLAVMRVESVYNPRIVSYAGAVGLMQIMPRTGRLIARSLGRESEFGVDDLLEPRTNLEFAAWYLSSLIRRFEGRVPLAIASYNGGPHNVRRWMNEYSSSMPLDAFLERIPFTQTHRYVRRVLSHWAAYRAQQGLSMVELDPTLPSLAPDRVAF
jgi:soluble lytic murein transglycosylase